MPEVLLRRRWLGGVAAFALALSIASCAPGARGPAGAPVADPGAAASELQRASVPEGPRQISFAWTLDEAGSRLRGQGVVRLVAPERLRLDLFGPRGETYLAAALVGEEFRLPTGIAGAFGLPSPSLLWGAVGVVQPPQGARLGEVATTEREIVVRYATEAGETFEYRAATDPLRVTSISRAGRSGVQETMQLAWDAQGNLQSTRYRDVAAFRELVLTIEGMTAVSSFPPAIWSPDGTAR